jgi:hypothetical protein
MVMALHPFESRKKRLENALTVAMLYIAAVGVFVGMAYAGGGSDWMDMLSTFGPYLIAIPAGIVALITYVRGSAKQ